MNCFNCQALMPIGADFCQKCGAAQRARTFKAPSSNNKSIGFWVMLILGVFAALTVIGLIFLLTSSRPSGLDKSKDVGSGNASQLTSTSPTPEVCSNNLEVVKSSWEKGGFDTVAVWHVTFRNRGTRSIGDIKYKTVYLSETGNRVDAGGENSLFVDHTIQKVIGPKKTRTLEINDGFLHSQAASANFEVVSCRFIN